MRPALILLDLNKPGPFLREPFKVIEVWGSGQVIILIPFCPSLRFGKPQEGSPRPVQSAINLKDQTAQ
jgi:hypothetical protein